MAQPGILETAAEWRRRFPGCLIFAGIDSIERLKGVALKLAAVHAFCEAHPRLVGRVVLVQLCVRDIVRPGDTQQPSLLEIQSLTDCINRQFGVAGGPPVVHLELRDAVPLCERLALWAAADCYVNTAIRDGLNMHPFEYAWVRGGGDCIPRGAYAQSGAANAAAEEGPALADPSPGCMVLSEFSGCSSVLTGALKINPFRLEEVTAALFRAATMTWEEQSARATATLQVGRRSPTPRSQSAQLPTPTCYPRLPPHAVRPGKLDVGVGRARARRPQGLCQAGHEPDVHGLRPRPRLPSHGLRQLLQAAQRRARRYRIPQVCAPPHRRRLRRDAQRAREPHGPPPGLRDGP